MTEGKKLTKSEQAYEDELKSMGAGEIPEEHQSDDV